MKLIILVGLPGSGKSTLAEKYEDYIIVNQDLLGDRYACLEEFRRVAAENKNIVIDRCNINKSQRKIWLYEAKELKNVEEINCIVLKTDPETCIKRISQRKGHPTIKEETSLAKIQEIVYNFSKSYEEPELSEGFNNITFFGE